MAPKVDPNSAPPPAPPPAPAAAPAVTAKDDPDLVPETPGTGFEFGANHTTALEFGAPPVILGQTFPGLVPPNSVFSLDNHGSLVWTNRGSGDIRSFDLTYGQRTDSSPVGASAPFSANNLHGYLNLGLNTTNWRFTGTLQSEPAADLPLMARLEVSRRPHSWSQLGTVQVDYGFRLSYLYDNGQQSFRDGNGDKKIPPSLIVPGGYFRITADKNWTLKDGLRLNLGADNQFDIDAPLRIVSGDYAKYLLEGNGTVLDLSALCGLGGMSDVGHMYLSLDISGKGWSIEPMLYADHAVSWADPTILPQWAANAGGGIRISVPRVTASAGLHAHMEPQIDRAFSATPEAFGTIDINLTPDGRLRISGLGRYRQGLGPIADPSGQMGNAVPKEWGVQAGATWQVSNNWLLSARGGPDTTLGTTGMLGLTFTPGGTHKSPANGYRVANPLQVNQDPARPQLDSRGQDRRYKLALAPTGDMAPSSLEPSLRALVEKKYPDQDKVGFYDVLQAIPEDQSQLLINFLNTPERISAALDEHVDYPARGAWPGEKRADTTKYFDLHTWGSRLLEAHGIDAVVETVTIIDRPQSVIIYRDPKSASLTAIKATPPDLQAVTDTAGAGNYTEAIEKLQLFQIAHPTKGLTADQKVGIAVALYGTELAADKANLPVIRDFLRQYRAALGVSDKVASGPSWNAMSAYALAPTNGQTVREALERYCSGRGENAPPQFFPWQPRGADWGPDQAKLRAANASQTRVYSEDVKPLGDISKLTYAQLVQRVKDLGKTDPEAAKEAIGALLGSNGPFTYKFHPGQPTKFSPEDFWNSKTGVCAEYHIFAASLMEAAGYEAHPVEIFGGGLAHVVYAFKDPKTGGWSVQDYDTGLTTKPPSPTLQQAIAAFEPSYSSAMVLETKGGFPAVYKAFYSLQHYVAQDFFHARP